MLKRITVFLYGSVSYVVFLATFLYTVGFVGNVFVRRSIDAPRNGNIVSSLGVDLALLLGIAIQHNVMARPAFKRWMIRFIPEPAERSTCVLASMTATHLLFAVVATLYILVAIRFEERDLIATLGSDYRPS